MKIHISTFLFFLGEVIEEGSQLKKRVGIKPPRQQTERTVRRRIGPICPFTRNAEGAAIQLAEQKSVDASASALLQNFEALAAKWMERMADFHPSQRRIALKCSSR